MRKTRLFVAAILAAFATPVAAQEVLNGRLDTASFNGGVGDRHNDSGVASGGTVIVYGSASSAASARAYAFAQAAAHASTHAGGRR